MVVAPPVLPDPSIAIAASRAGALGALDLQYSSNVRLALEAVNKLARFGRGACGVKLDGLEEALTAFLISALPKDISFVILTPGRAEFLGQEIQRLHRSNLRVLLEATCLEHAHLGSQVAADGVIAKGNEAAGNVGEETTFILLQRLLEQTSLPVWAQGGVGLHSAAACYVAGAAGALLDAQLWLTRESSLPETVKGCIARMDGSETVCLGKEIGKMVRIYARPGSSTADELRTRAKWLADHSKTASESSQAWRQAVRQRVGWKTTGDIWLIGQDAAFAKSFADRFGTVADALKGVRNAIDDNVRTAHDCRPFDRGSPMARSHTTSYPIVQGPMTRVSDTSAFVARVADAGGLPFVALALMRAGEVDALLTQTKELLGERPWGVGILGFVPVDVRSEQLEVIRKVRPPFALIAGGRPDQAQTLEQIGIPTYLHVPSPALLKLFVENGARRFVFEGRECGGHVGPLSSFVLWEQVTDALLEATSADNAADRYHILFAGGIHDARCSAMVAAIAAPLAAHGCRLGLLVGTAYLFTKEVVEAGAILEGFQQEAVRCTGTVLLESRFGHETRCARTPYAELFAQERRRLREKKLSVEEISNALEHLNLGRLRIASKGITHNPKYSKDPAAPQFIRLSEDQQHEQGMYMIGQVAALRSEVCSIAELHQEISIKGSEWLAGVTQPERTPASNGSESRRSDLAIIGMSCLFPKAGDLQTYWENILTKVNAIREIPEDRWNWSRYFDADPQARDKVYSKWGGFLDDVPFDPIAYGLPPSSLKSIEPLQLLTLEVVRSALEDAGYHDRPFARDRTSVILGVGGGLADLGHQYAVRSGLPMFLNEVPPITLERLPEWTEDSFPGILQNVAAGRVANRFNLGGVNFTVDAACASSLAAVYLAAHELRSGNSEMIIVGAADTVQNPLAYLCFSKTGALSPRGQCRTFDESADGIVISEGVAVIVLKRLRDAERDGDRIYALIKGVGSSSDGRGKSLTAPRPEGQILAVQRAYENAGFSPKSVGLIEAHGTGTVAGDRAEIEALQRVFEDAGAIRQTCAIGSVKSMIGHTKSAAGLAGLIKVAMSMYHKVLPPTAGIETPNRKVGFSESPLYVNSVTRPWVHDMNNGPRCGGVSAFGFGGTNFHAALEEYAGDFTSFSETRFPQERWPSELFLWQANTRQELIAHAQLVQGALAGGAHPALRDLASAVWQLSRQEDEGPKKGSRLTLAIVASSSQDLEQKLTQAIQDLLKPKLDRIENPGGIYFSQQPLAFNSKLAFLFPGQGSQYPDMLRELAIMFAEVRESFETADRVLKSRIPRGLSSYVFPPPRFAKEQEESACRALMRTDLAQPALGAAELGLFRLLGCFGVKPDMVAGHSYGEYLALHAAGVFDEECLLLLSESRGRFIREEAGATPGTMAAVEAGGEDIRAALEGIEDVWIANLNAPEQTVISGDSKAVDRALRTLASQGISARHLPVACAFHSPIVAAARDRLAELLLSIEFEKPQLEVFSNTSTARYPHDPKAIKTILSNHLTRSVDFLAEVEAVYDAGARIFVEVGPSSVLSGLTNRILRDRPHRAVATDVVGRSGLLQLQLALAQLGAEGVPVCLDRLFAGRRIRPLRLEHLIAETQEQPLPATTWLVNGGRARPLRESLLSQTTLQQASKPDVAVASNNSNGTVTSGAMVGASSNGGGLAAVSCSQKPSFVNEQLPILSPQEAPPSKEQVVPESRNPPSGNATEVMLQYQKLMNRFLDTQQQVMLAFLRNSNGASLHQISTSQGVGAALPQTAAALRLGNDASAGPSALVLAVPDPRQLSVAQIAPATIGPVLASATQDTDPIRTDEETLTQELINIVSERTGYPPEMLDLDLDLEADLGINSIKKVEILGTFQRQCSDAERQSLQSAMDRLTRLRTLRAVIEGITSALQHGRAEAVGNNQPAERTTEDSVKVPFDELTHDTLPRYRRVAVDAGAISLGSLKPPEGAVLITDDGRGVATALAGRLREMGARAMVIGPAGRLEPRDGSLAANFTDISALRGLIAEARKQAGTIGGLIHLLPLRLVDESRWMDSATWHERLDLEVRSLFLLAREIAHDLARARGAWFVAASSLGGDFGLSAPSYSVFPGHGAIAGFVKALATEWPSVRCKAIDFDGSQPANLIADWLLEELAFQDGELEVGRRPGQRMYLRTRSAPVNRLVTDQVKLTSDSVVLVTGGAKGITSAVAIEIARRYRPTLILIGRSPLPPVNESSATEGIAGERELKGALIEERRSRGDTPTAAIIETTYRGLLKEREMRLALHAMEHAGAKVHYYQADVSDRNAVARLINQTYETHGHLDGVIHGAGIIEDSLVVDKEPSSYDRVFGTKVQGALALVQNLRPESLKFLVFFSSVAGIFGNRGQSDYGAANEVLNKLALALDRLWPAHVVSINWGPWADIGMASPEVQQKFLARGVEPIKSDAGQKMFAVELACGRKGEAEVILGSGPWSKEQATPARENVGPLALLEKVKFSKSSRGDVEITCTFDLDVHSYLLDHKLDSRPVLPAAVGLEIMAEAAQCAWPDLDVISIKDFRVLNGIVLNNNSMSVRIRVSRETPTPGTHQDVAVRVEIAHPIEEEKFYQATVVLNERSAINDVSSQPVGLLHPFPWSVSAAYERFLFHGPVFQGIENIHGVSERCISASLVPSSPTRLLKESAAKQWLIDPVIVDGAFQLAILWARHHSDVTVLPVRFARFWRLAPFAGSRIRCNFIAQPNNGNQIFEAEISFLDEAGHLLALVEGMEFSGSTSLNRLSCSKAGLHKA
jgi:acyl transferase domain-containing protein/NAD(P)H-dependent flavin oxidoreductase YrpB (nitropropane dioxygenase family)